MFELLSFASILLFFVSLIVVSFRWFRSGSPDKLTNLSSSGESETPELAKQESAKKQPRVGKKGYNSFGQKNEGVQELQNDDSEQNESLRHRLSANKSSNGDEETKVLKSTTQSNASTRLQNSSSEPQKDDERAFCEKNDLGEVLPAYEPKETKQGTDVRVICKTNNVEVFSDKPSEDKSIAEPFEREQGKEESEQLVEQNFIQDYDADSLNLKDNVQEEANVNNAIDVLNELSVESNAVQKSITHDVMIEQEAEVTEVISSENAVELKEERNFLVEGRAEDAIKGRNIAGVQSNDDNDFEVVSNKVSKPLGVEERSSNSATESVDKAVDDDSGDKEVHNSLPEDVDLQNENQSTEPSVQQISDAYEIQPVNDVVEKFSDRLSRCILDTVLQDTQLLCSQSEDEHDESHSKERVLKFSDILAESIVRSVIDYAKVSQGHISEHDENDQLSPNVADVSNKNNEDSRHDVTYESSPPNEEDIFSADEANDDVCYKNVHDYAKRLSQQILSDVLDMHDQNGEAIRRSSTNVYATKLTETVISNAINGAKSRIVNSPSLPDSDMGIESALDLFIAEIVGNAVESAIARIAEENNKDSEEHHGNYRDLEGKQDMEELSEDPEGHGENRMDTEGHLEMHNGEIDCPNTDVDHTQNEPFSMKGASGQPQQQNGKLESKWLSDDDLDEIYDDDDVSDEEKLDVGESSKSVKNSNDEQKTAISANHLMSPSDEKQFWRRSLIEDLDDDMDFDENETPRSSISSSPTKTGDLQDFTVDGSADSDDEALVVSSPNVKIQTPVVKTSDSSRSRLRSVDTTPVLVLDNGSAFLKVGFSDQTLPKEIVASVVGTPLRYSQDISGMEYSARPGLVFGGNAMGKAGVLHIEYPLKTDLVEKWSDVEGLWNYVLGSLMSIQDNPDFPVLISQPAQNPKKNTEKIAEIMFEHFHMPSIFIADQLALSLFSMGYTSGLSFSSGFKSTQAGVVYEGHVLQHTVKQLDIAGYQLTENLKKLLMSLQGFGFRSSSQWQIVDDIKKKLGFFSLDFEAESKRYKTQAELQTTYQLPDGQVLDIGLERFGCAESLFRPMEVGLTQSPAHMLIIEAINSCEEELQELCYKAMGISGGTTLMNGFLARLEQELREHDRKFKSFTAPEHRDLSTWLGGSVVASLPTFREMVVTVDEYAESGARVIHSKCF